METVCFRVLVSGRVQGVFFRANTRAKALEYGVNGWVRNLPDGRVEAQLEGSYESVGRLVAFMLRGPPHARVDKLEASRVACEGRRGFEIIY